MSNPAVLVVGAGPTSLALACGLRAAGVSVKVIDKQEGPAVTSRAIGLQPRGSEVLDRLGALDRLPERSAQVAEFVTHLNGRSLLRLAVGANGTLASYPVLVNSQAEVEAHLRHRLAALGVEVEWGQELLEATQDALADTAFAGSTAPYPDTFSLVIDASSMIGSYTERLTVPARGLRERRRTARRAILATRIRICLNIGSFLGII
ncbi:FAD-dependent oxidoreductase [Streptomyces adustus]|uniref:FAD-dependent oxidoreductase n=1 Tax=Streptomyces adustus TaxID=1609272 RepID=UPI0035E39665